jgi:hypothetical protein
MSRTEGESWPIPCKNVLIVQALYGIGRVDDFADLLGISEKGDDLLPYPAPALDDCRQLFTPGTLSELLRQIF